MRVIIIGGGASGMMAALAAKEQGSDTMILEKMEKPGKKLLITGNGRCNLTNLSAASSFYYGSDPDFIQSIFSQFSVQDTLSFFHKTGLLTHTREELVYPYTDQASTVVDHFLFEMKRKGIKMKYQTPVLKIEKKENIFYLHTEGWTYEADQVILCTGSKSMPQTGSSGDGYRLAKACGHSLLPVLPALVPLRLNGEVHRWLSGMRSFGKVMIEMEEDCTQQEFGELQWTDYGVSGIVIFQLSRLVSFALHENKKVFLHIDFMPEYTSDMLEQMFLKKMHDSFLPSYEELLCGFLKKKQIQMIAKLLHTKASDKVDKKKCKQIISWIKDLKLEVKGTKSFDLAQVCLGGIPHYEVKEGTLESKKMPGLFFAGEILDVDGICGGFNLQWAWSSGYVAGMYAGKGGLK